MRPVELAFKMIELLSRYQPVGVTELARLADLPKSTAQRTLVALEKTGWIRPAASDKRLWVLTMQALVAAGRGNEEHAALRGVALPVMEELRRISEETVHLTYRFDRTLVLIERLDGIKPVRYFYPYGAVTDLHVTSSGRAILAALPDEELEAYLSDSRTPADGRRPSGDDFRIEIAAAREKGYARTLGGNRPDVHAVGAAILDRDGVPYAALSISAPSDRLTESLIEAHAPHLVDAARRIGMGVAIRRTSATRP